MLAWPQSTVVISQVYGGGGNAGAVLRNDFVELFNRGQAAVNIGGWTVQYAPASGSGWDRAVLSGTIQPGQYYLVELAVGSGGTTSLPAADASGNLNLSATSGKVALVSNSTLLSGAAPAGGQIADFVGYGTANSAEGRSAPELTNLLAIFRRSGGCVDSGDNLADFITGPPAPRNSTSPRAPCAAGPGPEISAGGIVNAASFRAGPVAPGEIITIFGSGLGPETLMTLQVTADRQFVTKSLAGTRVLFDGVAAPVVYTLVGQVSVVVPYAVQGRNTTEVQVEYNGRTSSKVAVAVAPAAPGIFTLDASGLGPGAIRNQDSQVNGTLNPASKGSAVIIYATGGGQTDPPGEDGRITEAIGRQVQRTSVTIGGVDADVLYSGPAPGLVHGAWQINAIVPESVTAGVQPVRITIGNALSQPGVVVVIAGEPPPAGTGPLIDSKLERLKRERAVGALSQIPTDRDPVPAGWLALLSWNVQVGGTSTAPGSPRPPMVKSALAGMFAGSYQVFAAQEIPNAASADLLRSLLPGSASAWKPVFTDTDDDMDNGIWSRDSVVIRDSFALLTTGRRDSAGRPIADPARALHPPQVAQIEAGSFDFTLISVHLTFAGGDTNESVRELRQILDYLDWYFRQPDHDPDVIVCGDFNTPSLLSGQTGRNGITLDGVFDGDPRFQTGERRFVVTVHDPTSRSPALSGGGPARNYDHCVLSADTMEEFVQARRFAPDILTDHIEDPEVRLTSDHFPVFALFRTSGEGISLDYRRRIRPDGAVLAGVKKESADRSAATLGEPPSNLWLAEPQP